MSLAGIFPIEKWDFESKSILKDLPGDLYEKLLTDTKEQTYKKGEIIFREGAFPTGIFYISKGRVKKYKVDKESREHIFYVANTGELIGYHAILARDRYPDFAATLEESKIIFIPKENFLEVMNQSTILTNRLLKTLSHEFAVLTNSVTLFSHKSVRERMALQLIVLREKYKVDFKEGMTVEINMSRDDLANLVGTARENVIRILTEYKEEGIVETKGRKIIITDVNKLIAIADYH